MKKTILETRGFTSPSTPFAPVVVAQGKFAFVSGQAPIDPSEKEITPTRGSLAEQFHLTMENVKLHLEAAGSSIENIVHVRVFLSANDQQNWRLMTEEFKKWFPDPAKWPARTTIGCQLAGGIDIEIDCIALVP